MMARYEQLIAWASICIGLMLIAGTTWAILNVSVGR